MKKRIVCKWDNYEKQFDEYIDFISRFFDLEKKPKGSKYKKLYLREIATFDFETTNISVTEISFVYAWGFCFGGYRIIGRTLQSFDEFMEKLSIALGDKTLLCFAHNLAFDWTYVSGIYQFKAEDCFFTDPRKILKCDYRQIELRCSYLLTGLSLLNFTKEMNVKHKKLSGEKYDYSRERIPQDGLKKYQLDYLDSDCVGLWEALKKFIKDETVYTLPLTKTGFVRRDLKKAVSKLPYGFRKDWQLDYKAYEACKLAFRGGNTHANRHYTGVIVPNVKSFDFASEYPAVMLYSDHFPKRNFTRKGSISFSDACYFAFEKKFCCIFRIKLINVDLLNIYEPFPYLSLSKVQQERGVILDNGRIIKASTLTTYCTDLDLKIILSMYKFDSIEVLDSFMCKGSKLPQPIREVIFKYYKLKTELKGLSGKDENGIDIETMYNRAKSDLNSCYGCFVTDPCKPFLMYDYVDEVYSFSTEKSKKELLEQYNKKAFLPFSVGVFVTSIARYWLQTMINSIPKSCALYVDTDSVKACNITGHEFDYWNEFIKEKAEAMNVKAYNKNGEVKYLGMFEYEGEYEKFVTLGAKKYCYEKDDHLHLTVAGVSKKKGAKELEENGGIKAFKDGFVFIKAGGTKSKYNDFRPGFDTFDIERKGYKIHITKNIYISPTEYTLGRTEDYLYIIEIARDLIVKGGVANEYEVVYNNE